MKCLRIGMFALLFIYMLAAAARSLESEVQHALATDRIESIPFRHVSKGPAGYHMSLRV